MPERSTLLDRLHGRPPDAQAFARALTPILTNRLLTIVWEAYEVLVHEVCAKIDDWDESFDDLERQLTEELSDRIQDRLQADGGFLPVSFRHGPFEREGRKRAPAQPRQYDLGFAYHADRRVLWPLEAKVVKGDADTVRNVGDYVDTVTGRFLSCAYAPFSPSGAMLAYLKKGNATAVLDNIGRRLECEMESYPAFATRPHRTSRHDRGVPAGKEYPSSFRCHHLVLELCVGDTNSDHQ